MKKTIPLSLLLLLSISWFHRNNNTKNNYEPKGTIIANPTNFKNSVITRIFLSSPIIFADAAQVAQLTSTTASSSTGINTLQTEENIEIQPHPKSTPLPSSSSTTTTTSASSIAATSSTTTTTKNKTNHDDHDNIIVVATVDGSFYGLSQNNGKIKWHSKSSSKKTIKSKNNQYNNQYNNHHEKNIHQDEHFNNIMDQMDHSTPLNHHRMKKSSSSESSSTEHNNSIHQQTNEDTIFAPLIYTSTTRSSTTNSRSSWRTSAVPSIDGKVFLTLGGVSNSKNQKNHGNQNNNRQDFYNYAIADTTITTSMKDIVNRSPFMDSRGRFYVSSKETYAIALDRDTGEIVKVVNGKKSNNHENDILDDNDDDDDGGGGSDNYDNKNRKNKNRNDNLEDFYDFSDIFDAESEKLCNGNNEYCQNNDIVQKEKNLIWMGRVDYSVSVHDARTGELDVQFATSEVLSLDDMIGTKHQINDGRSKDKYFENNGMLTLPAGEGETIGIEQETMMTSEIVTTPGGKVALRDPKSGQVMWIANDTFETPVAFAVESSKGSSLGVHVVPDAPNAHQFSKEYVSSELAKDMTENSFFTAGAEDDMSGTVFGALKTGQLFALPLGGHKSNSGPFGGLPHVPRLSSTVGSSKHSLEKLPLLSGHGELRQQGNDKNSYAVAIKKHMCDPNSENFPECILESYIKSNDDWLFNNNLNLVINPDQDFLFPQQNNQHGSSRRNNKFFFKLMTSWIPPVVALIFVVSFEMGRREKLRVEAARSKELLRDDSNTTQSDKLSTSQSEGVIDVYDEVLGYGGHGTVVYKGKLEGRYVAVKRMLKAYHASADREISLLIESDGHPNVVRYFLKEMRGDFVYLALELCDMNLQDLINVLTKKRLKSLTPQSKDITKKFQPVDNSTKQLLFEIASGVKHIHSLRIVHRDLKPANILLARKTRDSTSSEGEDELYKAFQSQDFVVKISDMGLGKQLLGQSSFGVSTMNNSFRIGASKIEGSTIAGAGPGSVGWQAPEVMAHRLSPESPLLQEESSNPDAIEASPINASLNGRTSRSVDIFSLGCIFFCTVLPGSHPFGEWYEREANIMKNSPIIEALQGLTVDAADLILSMLHRSPRSRPTASQVCNHPFFWSPMKRLSFLCDLSDRIEICDTDQSNNQFDPYVIEKNAAITVGTSWDTKLDTGFFNHVAKYRKYDPCSVRDCLRLIRNRNHHFDELPADLKERVCSNQEEMIKYFESVFPYLLMHCYNTCREHGVFSDNINQKYEIPSKNEKLKKEVVSSNNSESNSNNSTPIHNTTNNKFEPTKTQLSYGSLDSNSNHQSPAPTDVIIWEKSSAASAYNCRGWMRSEEEWMYRVTTTKKRELHLTRCAEDGKYRTRLCNHWDESLGTYCPIRKKNKCDFAHGPVELRVKEGKRNRWGKLVDVNGNNSNPKHSGGEDT